MPKTKKTKKSKKENMKCEDDEVFKPLPKYEKLYEVSNYANVKSLRTDTLLKQYAFGNALKIVRLQNSDLSIKRHYVDNLIATTFIEKPDITKDYGIKHINDDLHDNNLTNLQWVSHIENEIKYDEIFQKIPEYEKLYTASNYGNIKSLRSGKLLKQHINYKGYKTVGLYGTNIKDTKYTTNVYEVHTLIVKAFIKKPDSDKPLVVDHINGCKTDNAITNLRWVTRSLNGKNAYKNNKNLENIKKPIYKLDLDGNIIKRYESVKDATLKNDFICMTSIIRCCKNNKLSIKKTKWKYCNNEVEVIIHDDEIFKKIDYIKDDKFDNYEISNYGKIRNIKTGKYRKPCDGTGYYIIRLWNIDKKDVYLHVHRIVATIFISREDKIKVVNHKDECKLNNKWTNLEWLDNRRENTVYSIGKKIKQLDPNTGEVINRFNCIQDAYRHLDKNGNSSGIQKCLTGEQKTTCGYKWELQ